MPKEISICLLGDEGVGSKTSLAVRFVSGTQPEDYCIIQSYKKTYWDLHWEEYNLKIEDTPGAELQSLLRNDIIRSSECYIVGYSITCRRSYATAGNMIQQITKVRDCDPFYISIILIGNKVDMENHRQISTQQGQELADKYSIPFIETSALENINITECFEMIVAEWNTKANLIPLKIFEDWINHSYRINHLDKKALKKMKITFADEKSSKELGRELLWIAVSNNNVKCVSWIIKEFSITATDVRIRIRRTTILDESVRRKNKKIEILISDLIDITKPAKSAASQYQQ